MKVKQLNSLWVAIGKVLDELKKLGQTARIAARGK